MPVTEDHPLVPVDVNGINLIAGESYHLLYHDVHGIPAVSLRLTNTYGPHLLMKHGRQGFITAFIRLAIEGKDIQVFGDGSQLRDFTYVSDAVDAFLSVALVDAAYGRALNVGGREPVSLLEVAELCQEIADAGGGVETAPWPPDREKIDIGSIYVSHDRLTELTGWTPRVAPRGPRADHRVLRRARGALLELRRRRRSAAARTEAALQHSLEHLYAPPVGVL